MIASYVYTYGKNKKYPPQSTYLNVCRLFTKEGKIDGKNLRYSNSYILLQGMNVSRNGCVKDVLLYENYIFQKKWYSRRNIKAECHRNRVA